MVAVFFKINPSIGRLADVELYEILMAVEVKD